jgi:hypothetical protein
MTYRVLARAHRFDCEDPECLYCLSLKFGPSPAIKVTKTMKIKKRKAAMKVVKKKVAMKK